MSTLQAIWGSIVLGWSLGMALQAVKTGHAIDRWAAGVALTAGVFTLVIR